MDALMMKCRRMAKASTSFGWLRQRLGNNHHVSMRVKGKIYRAIMLSTLLYGAEAWTVYRRQVKKNACLHDVTSAFDHEDNLDGQNDKQGHTQTDRAPIYGRSSDQKDCSGLDTSWRCHQTGYQIRLSTLNCLLVTEREGALISGSRISSRETWSWETQRPTPGHHSHSREINGEQQSNDGSSLCRIATDSMMMITIKIQSA